MELKFKMKIKNSLGHKNCHETDYDTTKCHHTFPLLVLDYFQGRYIYECILNIPMSQYIRCFAMVEVTEESGKEISLKKWHNLSPIV